MAGDKDTVDLDWERPAAPTAAPVPVVADGVARPAGTARYTMETLLGRGGMGEVWRARDAELDRTVALKILHTDRGEVDWGPFLAEARATAGLQHPGIVPSYDLGRLPDGRIFYTMQEIRGRTLREAIHDAHRPGAPPVLRRRLLEAYHRVCVAMGFAHRSDWIHRDLKPGNVMLGGFGEVYVVDWGLAMRIPLASGAARRGVSGTPSYMSPEQARGELDVLGPQSDVYALGTILYVLLAGREAYRAANALETLLRVKEGARALWPPDHNVPRELQDICDTAMAFRPEDRFVDAAALGLALQAWLEGERQRELALAELATADAMLPEIRSLRQEARQVAQAASAAIALLRPSDAPERKREAWALEDRAREIECAAEVQEVRWTRAVHSALERAPELPEPRARLASAYMERLDEALEDRNPATIARYRALLAAWSPDATMRSVGVVTLKTTPPAGVQLASIVEVERRLVPDEAVACGVTPLRAMELEAGAWCFTLDAPGHAEVVVPVRVPAGGTVVVEVVLPPPLSADRRFVAGGPARLGGDPRAAGPRPAEVVEVPPFVIQTNPVTNGEYLRYIHALAAGGRAEEAMEATPRPPAGIAYDWTPAVPVTWITPAAGRGYAAWLAAQEGVAWRLPTAEEREKAARGVDGRSWPWGDHHDASFANMRSSRETGPLLMPVTAFPGDVSVYGVCGLAGNVSDLCTLASALVACGGSWSASADDCRSAGRHSVPEGARLGTLGLRLVATLLH